MHRFVSFIYRVICQAIDRLGTRIQAHDMWAFVFLATWHSLYFFPVTLAQRVWYTRDILGQYYPFALEYARALSVGQLPLWTTLIHAGFPLLAEGQVATFYPTRAFLLMLMPAHFALSFVLLTGATIGLVYNLPIDFWLNVWQTLPFGLGVFTAFPWMSVPAIRSRLSPNTNMPYGIEHAQDRSSSAQC